MRSDIDEKVVVLLMDLRAAILKDVGIKKLTMARNRGLRSTRQRIGYLVNRKMPK